MFFRARSLNLITWRILDRFMGAIGNMIRNSSNLSCMSSNRLFIVVMSLPLLWLQYFAKYVCVCWVSLQLWNEYYGRAFFLCSFCQTETFIGRIDTRWLKSALQVENKVCIVDMLPNVRKIMLSQLVRKRASLARVCLGVIFWLQFSAGLVYDNACR